MSRTTGSTALHPDWKLHLWLAIQVLCATAAQYADAKTITISELCDLYLNEGVSHKKPSTLRGATSRTRHYIKPRLGRRPISSVARADVERLLRKIVAMPYLTGRRAIFNHGKHTLTGGPGAGAQCVAVLGTLS
jgi:hypothetical protein